jgi:hypothetical protein
MNKTKDLKIVFEFIADFLREDESLKKASEPKVSTQAPVVETKLNETATHIRKVMERVEEKDRSQTKLNVLNGVLSKEKSSFSKKLLKSKKEEEEADAKAIDNAATELIQLKTNATAKDKEDLKNLLANAKEVMASSMKIPE